MPQLQVIVNKLNKRKSPVLDFADKTNVVEVLNKGSIFESDDEITNVLGKWYKDRDGFYYWGKGVANVAPDSPALKSQIGTDKKDWGFTDYKIDELWKLSKGENIQVTILDSGLNYNLDDFKNRSNISFYNAETDSNTKEDCLDDSDGHGTDCAGLLCAQGNRVWGIAPNIFVNVIKITNSNGTRTLPAILRGLEKAILLNSDVISLSFSISKNDSNAIAIENIHKKIQEAYNKNITVVASTEDGNLPFAIDKFPASFAECLSVGSVDKNRIKASNKSNFIDLMGPGKEVFSLTRLDESANGTSFATPFVAGVIALLKSIAKKDNLPLSNIQLFDILKRSANTQIFGYNKLEYGWGIINPLLALTLLQKV